MRIRPSVKFKDRAEIVLKDGELLLAAGSYDEIVSRIVKDTHGQFARLD